MDFNSNGHFSCWYFYMFRLEDIKLGIEQKEIEQRIENLEKILK